MIYKKIFFAFIALLPFYFSAQEKLIDTVKIVDRQLISAEKTQTIYKISATDIEKNSTNLSDALRFQSPVYIKENGVGMVSSPSFRGTTAQQTAFLWNGINVNSIFLGQGDINNLGLLGYDNLDVKSGGGSVVYGSGAIGGTVHLNNELAYNRGWKNKIFLQGGSFLSFNSLLKTSFSDEKLSFNFSGSYNQSQNNYEVPEKFYKNYNGQFHNTTFNLGVGYRLSPQNEMFWQSQFYDGLQHYPISSETGNKTMYSTDNFRSLLGWNFHNFKIKNQLAAAYLEENFGYFANIDQPQTSGGKGESYILKDDFNYFFNSKLIANFLSEYRKTKGFGYGSGIANPERNSGSVALLLKYQATEKLYLEGGIKKEWVEKITTPVLYSAGMQWKATDFYTMKISASKNFRYPSFNDLYWQPGGNLDLKSETSYQGEFGNEFKYKNLKISSTPFLIYIENMIQWLPTSAGYWAPTNVYKVRSFGLESQLSYQLKFNENLFKFSGGYIYTNSQNIEAKTQMMYVPRHKAFGTLDYHYKIFGIYVQGMYNGLTFTTTDESQADALKTYIVMNAGATFTFYKKFEIGAKVNNLTDQIYESVSYYPLPKRNYSAYINLNF